MAEAALIGIDVGTTGTKVGVCTASGHLLSLASAGYELQHPGPGAAEQDPDEWWAAATRHAVRSTDST